MDVRLNEDGDLYIQDRWKVWIDIDESGSNFLKVISHDADRDPFGAALDTVGGRLLVPSNLGLLDIFDVSGSTVTKSEALELKRAISNGAILSNISPTEVAIAGSRVGVIMNGGGMLVLNLDEIGVSGVNPVDYYISDLPSPRGIASDGNNFYVSDVETSGATVIPYLRVLDLSTLPADPATHSGCAAATVCLVDKDDDSLLVASIEVGTNPREVAVSTTLGKAFVTNLDDDTVSVIDTTTHQVDTTITVGDEPFGMALYQQTAGTDSHLLVCNRQSNTVSIIDLATSSIVGTYPSP